MVVIKKLKDNKLIFIAFFPIYFSRSGIYNNLNKNDNRLVLPLTFFIGIILTLILIADIFKRNRKFKVNDFLLFIVLMLTLTSISLWALAVNKSITILINTVQLFTGFIGISFGIYFKQAQYTREEITKSIADVFFFVIISNFILVLLDGGVVNILSGRIKAKTPLGGIHQSLVYYPYIISMVFLYDLPRVLKQKKLSPQIIKYGIVTLYILLLQVRGAVLSHFLGVIVFILFSKTNRKSKRIFLLFYLFIMILLIIFVPKHILFGRFINHSSSVISGRELIWEKLFLEIRQNPLVLFFGNLKGYRQTIVEGGIEFHGASFHNQYLEFLGIYGILGSLSIYVFIYYYYYKKIQDKYFIALFLVHIIIDLNVNVPLRITNPAIFYHFYWYISSNNFQKNIPKFKTQPRNDMNP